MPSNEAADLPASASPAAGSGKPSAPSAAPQGGAKIGAPGGNRNAERHGVWSFLALGRLPKGGAYIRRLLGELRRELETRVSQAHGEVSLGHAALVTTVCRHEGRALLLSRYLALEGDGLKLMDRVSVLESIGRATDARDKAIAALKLQRSPGDALSDFYAQLRAGAFDTPPDPPTAPAALPGPQAADSAAEALRPAADQYTRPLENST